MRLRTRVINGQLVVEKVGAMRPYRQRGRAWQRIRMAVARRDNWTCQICHEPIDPKLRKPHPMALDVDHIKQRQDGGTDELPNLRATHADCNRRRKRV